MQVNDVGESLDAKALGDCLVRHNGFVVTAESCTGGLIGGALTSVAGSSKWFDRGWITYTNKAKHEQLGVSEETLKDFGAVSEPVARQMAAGALAMAPQATLALAVTGIAGPGGGSPDKPVGLVWFGFARRAEDDVIVSSIHRVFVGNRQAVREATVTFALQHALKWINQDD
ncbi:MAG: CinA family protein [Burkholderiaceae bacterium]|nr:CinA family protein [Burkholderiaceae bacterium]MCD8517315.1 CinA family protein [Burkholderiaceae bacterium]MCD8537616.1 CinA family protein [Burkholderiaceae bacterium]MCD8566014.1 CinA family protein [Burkholderiaceae bacterium]